MLSINSLKDIHQLVTKRQIGVMDAVEIASNRARRRKRWRGEFHVSGLEGGKPFSQVVQNALYNQGEQDILETFFRAAAAPTTFNLGLLRTTYSLLETDTMTQVAAAELANATEGGYSARQALTRDAGGWPTSALDSGDWMLTSAQVTWTATGAWTNTAGYMFLMSGGTTAPANTTGRILAVGAMSPTRQLQAVNDILRITYNLKLQ